jgi:hypothetical protein
MSNSAILSANSSGAEDELASAFVEPPRAIHNAKLLAAPYGEFALAVIIFSVPDIEFEADVWRA